MIGFGKGKGKAEEDFAEEEDRREWHDVNENVKYVCQGGKVRCRYCSVPEAAIIVTAESIMLQDKPWATVGDNNGQVNFNFTGLCTHPKWGSHKPSCKSVISLGQWKNYSETVIGNHHALLAKSTIPCMVSGEDLKIVHSGQTATLEQINPLDRRKVILDAYWIDGETERRDLPINFPVTLYIQVKNAKPGESITLDFVSINNNNLFTFHGIVGENNIITIDEFILK